MITLKATLDKAQALFTSIGMKIDPDKSDLMHFSNRRGHNSSPSLSALINGQHVTISPPKFIRWLGFYFDRKLTFNDHTKIMCAKASNVMSGLSCLGNTITGMTPNHLHLLFKTCVVPVMTYGCQLWFRPSAPRVTLMKRLQVVQNKGLRRVAGAFRTTPADSLPLLTFQPPIHVTIRKLCDSAALRLFQLPLNSELSLRIPKSFIPSPFDSIPIPSHIPFKRPLLIKNLNARSPLVSLAGSVCLNTERSEPFHSHNAPYAFTPLSFPFIGRLFFNSIPCDKKDRPSLVSKHNVLFLKSFSDPSTLIVFTDGSHRDNGGTGYGLLGFLEGDIVFRIWVPFACKASNYDAEMYALAHAAIKIRKFIIPRRSISHIQIFSDAASAIEKIFDGSPHPSQTASILFRHSFFTLFSERKDISCHVTWTPGHGGMKGMKLADSLAKKASLSKRAPLVEFTSRSAALHNLEVNTLARWKKHIEDHPFEETSFFYSASQVLHPHLRPPKWFKKMNRPTFSRLTQFTTGHAYTGEYFKRFNIPKPTVCPCHSSGYPPVLHSRDHLLRACPHFESQRILLRRHAPRIDNPKWSIGNLLRDQHFDHLEFLSSTGALSRGLVPKDDPIGVLPPVLPPPVPTFRSPP